MTKILVDREVLQAAWVALNNAEDALNNSIVRTQHQITKECCVIALEFVGPSLAQLRALLDQPDAPEVSPLIVKGALTGMVDAVIKATYPTGLKEQQ